jgi:PLD-like domain
MGGRRRWSAAIVAGLASLALGVSPASLGADAEASLEPGPASDVTYETFFTQADNSFDDTTLENVVAELLDAAPTGSHIRVAMYSWTRLPPPLANGFINAQRRGVDIQLIIGKDSMNTAAVRRLRNNIPAANFTFCGLGVTTEACLNSDTTLAHINHNKFFLFSALNDGSRNVVVQSSANLTNPMLNNHNNLVIVRNDEALYEGYLAYWNDMKSQQRVADYGKRWSGESATLITFNRPDVPGDEEDPLVEALAALTCSAGGAPDAKGLVRVAHSSFVASRMAAARQLERLKREGCTVEVLAPTIDAEPAALFNNAGIPAIARRDPGGLHSKIVLADTTDASGVRRQIVWTGSHTLDWASLHGNDETLLRIEDARVFDAFNADWEGLRARTNPVPCAVPASDDDGPYADLHAAPPPNTNGWNNSDVTLELAAADGFFNNGCGVKKIVVELSGAHDGIVIQDGDRATVTLSEEGVTNVRWYAVDVFGNDQFDCGNQAGFLAVERPCFPPGSLTVRIDKSAATIHATTSPAPNAAGWNNSDVTVRFEASDATSGVSGGSTQDVSFIREGAGQTAVATFTDLAGNSATASTTVNLDKTAPTLAGLPLSCVLWPPNHQLVDVATVTAADGLSGVGDFSVTATSSEAENGLGDGDVSPDIAISGGSVRLRAERSGTGEARTYVIESSATDVAGNITSALTPCTVGHNRRR